MSATPWAQLQSLVGSAEGEDLEEEPEIDEGADYLSMMSAYGGVIAEFFGVDSPSFAGLTLKTIAEADFADRLEESPPGEKRLIDQLVAMNERFYLPHSQLAYLGSPSLNSAAEFAAIHLLHCRGGGQRLFEGGRAGFFRLALEAA
jgi:hypothetical protein